MNAIKKSFLLLVLMSSFFVHAQLVVSDPTAAVGMAKMNAGMVTSITKASTQIKVAMDQYNTYKNEISKLKQVASVIQQGKLALTVLDNFKQIGEEVNVISNKLSRVNPKYRGTWARNLDTLLSEITVVTQTSAMVIKQNSLEMNDADRLQSMLEVYKLSNELRTKTGQFSRKLNAML